MNALKIWGLVFAGALMSSCALLRDYSRIEEPQEPPSVDWLARGDSAYEREEYAQAVVWYRLAAREGAQPAVAWFNAANALVRMDRAAEAREAYRRSLEASPDFLKARQNLAALYQLEGNVVEAARQYEAAVRLDDKDANSRYRLGELAQQAGDFAEALRWYERALAVDSLHEGAASGTAQALLSARDSAAALAWLERFNARAPKPAAWALVLQGDLARRAGLRDAAMDLYRDAAAASPTDSRPWLRMARLLRDEGRPLEAGIVLGQAVRAAPGRGELWAAQGGLRLEGEDPVGAREAYLRSFRLGSPEGLQGLQTLAAWYERRQDSASAKAVRDSMEAR